MHQEEHASISACGYPTAKNLVSFYLHQSCFNFLYTSLSTPGLSDLITYTNLHSQGYPPCMSWDTPAGLPKTPECAHEWLLHAVPLDLRLLQTAQDLSKCYILASRSVQAGATGSKDPSRGKLHCVLYSAHHDDQIERVSLFMLKKIS